MAIAFFDLDKTLLRKNSGGLWIRHEFRSGHINFWQGVRAFWWLARYSIGIGGVEEGLYVAIQYLRGGREDEMRMRVGNWYETEVRDLVRPGAREALEQHRGQGHRLVLLTSSSNYLSERFAQDLDLDDYLCSRFEVDADGRFTGYPMEPLCYGHGKLELAQAYCDAQGIALHDCHFYTDSMTDLPVLEAVGQPVCINPDPRLNQLARRRGWPVFDWGP